jgi:hypothetical protein
MSDLLLRSTAKAKQHTSTTFNIMRRQRSEEGVGEETRNGDDCDSEAVEEEGEEEEESCPLQTRSFANVGGVFLSM